MPELPIVITADDALHVPPGVADANVVAEYRQTLVLPVIAAGSEFIVTVVVVVQPAEYDIMAVPGPPETLPDAETGIVVLLLLHVPPGVPEDSAIGCPWHTAPPHVIAAGSGFMVTVVVCEQPAPRE